MSQLEWTVAGSITDLWRFFKTRHLAERKDWEVYPTRAKVPGSVQGALREAGVLPDWNLGLNANLCEWVENRDWIFETTLPEDWQQSGRSYRLHCQGLDYCGSVLVNGKEAGSFKNAFVPHVFDLTPHLEEKDNVLQIAFTPPPRWLGQFAWTCNITEWKPRFYYYWDWTSRLVQTGIWDGIHLEVTDGTGIEQFTCVTNADPAAGTGSIKAGGTVTGDAGSRVQIELLDGERTIRTEEILLETFASEGLAWEDLPIGLWWPNGEGEQPLYTLRCRLLDQEGQEVDAKTRRVGFKHVTWQACEDAPPEADPWICVTNGRPIFLQGVNWTPIRPNFADVTEEDYRKRLENYRDLGMNMMRVWGGGMLEKEWFYNLCDELGILVWQEFPLSSSGMDSWPPDTEPAMTELCEIARSYITRRQSHVSLTIWCGGNELSADKDGGHSIPGGVRPVDTSHPLLKRFEEIVGEMDPTRRYLATSPSGPTSCANDETIGKGIDWDVHGPWKAGELKTWTEFFAKDDSLFRSETGAPGASSVELIRKYKGELEEFPCAIENPLWRRHPWWIERDDFFREFEREPRDLEEYVAWNQERQAQALSIAVEACKNRFPKCGGILLWMGHDSYPCTANTSVLDFEGDPKPAALAVGEIFRRPLVASQV